MSAATTSASVVPITSTPPIQDASGPVAPASVVTLLRSFQSMQSARASAYARFKAAFRRFMDEREAWEEQVARDAERAAKRSTHMVKAEAEGDKDKDKDKERSPGANDAATLASIREDNEAAARRAQPNPEQVFQRVCVEIMAEFQSVSKEVRGVIAALKEQAGDATTNDAALPSSSPSAAADAAATSAHHFSVLLSSLQLLEKLKLELTIHQQMLHNQAYVLAHPQQHGQLQEHHHHVHSVTDAQGRVRQHPKHAHAHAHGDLGCVSEEHEHEDEQELADNAQPFTRHLSALLSDTAFATQSPFLFPPSGAAPTPLVSAAAPAPGPDSDADSSHPSRSPEAEAAHRAELLDLREQENGVVEKINDILEEVRQHIMDEEEEEGDEEEEAEDRA